MRLGRDGRALLLVVIVASLLGWGLQRAMGPPPGPGGPWPHPHGDGEGAGGPRGGRWWQGVASRLLGGHGPHHAGGHGEEGGPPELVPADSPLLQGRSLERFAPSQVFRLAVQGAGWLVEQRGPRRLGSARYRFMREGTFAFARHDGDLVTSPQQAHVAPICRIPQEAAAVSISSDGLVLAFCPAGPGQGEACFRCGRIDLALLARASALQPDGLQAGLYNWNEAVGEVTFWPPGAGGTGRILVVH